MTAGTTTKSGCLEVNHFFRIFSPVSSLGYWLEHHPYNSRCGPRMISCGLSPSNFLATFGDVDDKTRRIAMRYEKADLENNIASGSRFRTKEWEDLWIENVTDDSKVTLAGACKKCFRTSAIVVDYLEYKKGILTSKKGLYATACPKCNAKKSFYVLPDRDSKDLQRLLTLRFEPPSS